MTLSADNSDRASPVRSTSKFDYSKSPPLIIELYGAAVLYDLAKHMAAEVWLRYHVSAFAGRALLCQLIEFWRQAAEHAILHVSAKENEVLLQEDRVTPQKLKALQSMADSFTVLPL